MKKAILSLIIMSTIQVSSAGTLWLFAANTSKCVPSPNTINQFVNDGGCDIKSTKIPKAYMAVCLKLNTTFLIAETLPACEDLGALYLGLKKK